MFHKIYNNKSPFYLFKLQWNLPKADTHGTKKFVRFRVVSALERLCVFWPEARKNPTPETANLLGIPIIPFTLHFYHYRRFNSNNFGSCGLPSGKLIC